MTLDELKAEAKKQGFSLQKSSAKVRFTPCVCGCNRRTEWTGPEGWFYECRMCELVSPPGKTKQEARRKWNAYIGQLKEEAE